MEKTSLIIELLGYLGFGAIISAFVIYGNIDDGFGYYLVFFLIVGGFYLIRVLISKCNKK